MPEEPFPYNEVMNAAQAAFCKCSMLLEQIDYAGVQAHTLLVVPVGFMLGCCTAQRAVQWSLLTLVVPAPDFQHLLAKDWC